MIKKGVTLIEVLIASAIAIILMTAMWSMFSSGVKQFIATQKHTEAIQVAKIVLEHIENNLQTMAVVNSETETILDDMTPRNHVSFYATKEPHLNDGTCRAEKVSFGVTPIDGTDFFYFTMNEKVMYNMPLKRLWFEPIEIPALDDGIDGDKKSSRFFIRIHVVALDSSYKNTFSLIGITALDLLCLRKREPYWKAIEPPCIQLK